MTKLFFATDLHGSERCWKKFINVPQVHSVDATVLGGDITGKMVVPIIHHEDGRITYYLFGRVSTVKPDGAKEAAGKIRDYGYYPYECDASEVEDLRKDQKRRDRLFIELTRDGISRWLKIAEERKKSNVSIYVCTGNDDTPAINDILESSSAVTYCDDRCVELDDLHEMVSCSYSNPTPWKTPKELPEEKLQEKLEKLIEKASGREHLICNFHPPPYNSGLDIAPELDEELRQVATPTGQRTIPVGSKAVRNVIEKYQPLLGLHGHIHECSGTRKIGRTLCLNPGSEYGEGYLRGYIVELGPKGIVNHYRVYG